MQKNFLMVTCWLLTLGGFTVLGQAPSPVSETIKAEMKIVLENHSQIYKQNFKVEIDSKVIGDYLSKQMNGGSPIPIKPRLYLYHKNGKSSMKVKLPDVPEAFRQPAEQKCNQMLTSSKLNETLPKITHSFLQEGIKLLLDNPTIRLVKETPTALYLQADEIDKPFGNGLIIQTIQLSIDRDQHVVDVLKFKFQDKKFLAVKNTFVTLKAPGPAAKVCAPQVNVVKQNLGLSAKGYTLPRVFSINFKNYQFLRN